MRVQDGLVVAIGLAVVLACGARAEAQELGPVIEAIEALHAERLDVLRTLAEASEADAEETPGRLAGTRVGDARSGDGRRCREGA